MFIQLIRRFKDVMNNWKLEIKFPYANFVEVTFETFDLHSQSWFLDITFAKTNKC